MAYFVLRTTNYITNCPATYYNRQKTYKNTLKVGSVVPMSVQAAQGETNIFNSANSSELICGTARNQINKAGNIILTSKDQEYLQALRI